MGSVHSWHQRPPTLLGRFSLLVALQSGDEASILALAMETFTALGIAISVHKTEGPSWVVTFLGILLDTVAGQLRLPPDKLRRLQDMIALWARKKSCIHRDLERFLGYLCHAATVVRPGRTFLRELFRLLHQAKQPHHFIRLSAGAHADILWWKCLLHHWSGCSFFLPPTISHHIYSDASGSWGCGAYAEGVGWFQISWPEGWQLVDMSV